MNGVSATTNGVNKSTEENSFNSLWSTNGISNGNNSAVTALTNGSRTQNSYNKLDLFSSNDNNSLFNSSNNNSHMTQQTNGISLNNGINLSASSDNGLSNGFHGIGSNDKQRQQQQNVITKNGLNLQQMSPSSSSLSSAASNFDNSSNLFTPDSDFVADFGSANIFNAMNNKPATTNGNPMKPIHLNGPITNGNRANGFDKMTNGKRSNGYSTNGTTNGFDDVEIDNFADFEHNTIYNAAGKISLLYFMLDYYFPVCHTKKTNVDDITMASKRKLKKNVSNSSAIHIYKPNSQGPESHLEIITMNKSL